jgi:hypothetical protein
MRILHCIHKIPQSRRLLAGSVVAVLLVAAMLSLAAAAVALPRVHAEQSISVNPIRIMMDYLFPPPPVLS